MAGGADSDLISLLNELKLLPLPGAKPTTKAFGAGDEEFQVLKAGVTKAANRVSKTIGLAGGAGAAWAAVEAYLNHSKPGLQIALVASAAVLVGLAALAVALVLAADLRARAVGTAAQYQARGQVAAAYEVGQTAGRARAAAAPGTVAGAVPTAVPAPGASPATAQATAQASPAAAHAGASVLASDQAVGLLALATAGRQVRARVKASGDLLYVTGLRYQSGALKLRLTPGAAAPEDAGSWFDFTAVDEFDTTA